MRNRNTFNREVDIEVESIIDQCCVIMARSAQAAFGHVATHLTDLRRTSLFVRGLDGIQQQWQMPCLVIATIDVMPAYQRQGLFKKLLSELLRLCEQNKWVLKFENVLNEDLRGYLSRNGFAPAPDARDSALLIGSMYWTHDSQIPEQLPRINLSLSRGSTKCSSSDASNKDGAS